MLTQGNVGKLKAWRAYKEAHWAVRTLAGGAAGAFILIGVSAGLRWYDPLKPLENKSAKDSIVARLFVACEPQSKSQQIPGNSIRVLTLGLWPLSSLTHGLGTRTAGNGHVGSFAEMAPSAQDVFVCKITNFSNFPVFNLNFRMKIVLTKIDHWGSSINLNDARYDQRVYEADADLIPPNSEAPFTFFIVKFGNDAGMVQFLPTVTYDLSSELQGIPGTMSQPKSFFSQVTFMGMPINPQSAPLSVRAQQALPEKK